MNAILGKQRAVYHLKQIIRLGNLSGLQLTIRMPHQGSQLQSQSSHQVSKVIGDPRTALGKVF